MIVRGASGQVFVISRYVCRAVALCFGGILFSLVASRSCLGESVSYFGRDFSVDKLERVDGDRLSIDLDNRSFLVQSANAGRQVFQVYAQKPELLSPNGVDKAYGIFLSSLAAQGETEAASGAIRGLLSSEQVSDERKVLVFGGVVASSQGEALLREEILHAQGGARRGGCIALRSIPSDGQLAIKKLLTSEASWIASQCPRILITSAQASFESGDTAVGGDILGFVGNFFAGSGGEIAQSAKTSAERYASVQRAIDSGDADQFDSELRVASFDALLGEYYQKFKPSLVIEFSEHAFVQHRAAAVLRGLSLIEFSQRNSKHHELLLKAVQQLQCKDIAVLQMEAVEKILLAYASKDEAVKQQYVSFLSACIEQAEESDDGRPGIAFVSLLSDVRPDPNTENDILRSTFAESFFDKGDKAGAEMVLSGVRTTLPWIYRFRLLLKSDAYVLGMVLLGLLVVVRWFLKLGGAVRKSPSTSRSSKADTTTSDRREATRKGKDKKGRRSRISGAALSKQIYKELDEYADCLSRLSLQPGASLSDIKNAYRHIVKELHPDKNPKAAKENTDRFIELTKTYERLLVLHEEREKKPSDS